MSAVAAEETVIAPDPHEGVVKEALLAFASDIHYLEDMVKVAQRVVTKRAGRPRLTVVD